MPIFVFQRIDADFQEKVGDNEDDFKKTVRTQIARILDTPESNIRDLKVKEGSIVVIFKLVGSKEEKEDLENAYDDFVNLLKSGKLTLVRLIDVSV